MTDTEVHVEHDSGEHTEDLAEAIADAQLEVAHELQQEAAVEQAQEQAESALEVAQNSASIGHEHPDYALVGHSHPELDHSERITLLESRIENIEHGLAEEVEEPVEEIEPTETAPVAPEKKPRRHSFGRR
jgi:hypothetical protein